MVKQLTTDQMSDPTGEGHATKIPVTTFNKYASLYQQYLRGRRVPVTQKRKFQHLKSDLTSIYLHDNDHTAPTGVENLKKCR
jgi:hypothetical protein